MRRRDTKEGSSSRTEQDYVTVGSAAGSEQGGDELGIRQKRRKGRKRAAGAAKGRMMTAQWTEPGKETRGRVEKSSEDRLLRVVTSA